MKRLLPILTLLGTTAHAQEPSPDGASATEESTVESEVDPTSGEQNAAQAPENTDLPTEPIDSDKGTNDPEAPTSDESHSQEMMTDPESGESITREEYNRRYDAVIAEVNEVDLERLKQERENAQAQLQRYCELAERVVIGQVISVSDASDRQNITLIVEQRLRGRVRGSLDIQIAQPQPTEDPTRIIPHVLEDYRVLMFTDRANELIEGNAVFLMQGGHAWRNKRPDVFLKPSSDRDWELNDPNQDYTIFSLDQIIDCLE